MRDSFVFRKDWFLAFKDLDNAIIGEICKAVMSQVYEDETLETSPLAQGIVRCIMPQIKSDTEKYIAICEKRKAYGSKGGLAKASKSYQKLAKASKSKQNVASVADNDNNILSSTNVESNNDINLIDIYIDEKKKTKLNYPEEFEQDFKLYGRKGSKKNAFERWKKLSGEDKELMRQHIPHYLESNERQYLKDFEGYINQRLFETPVYRQSTLLFDPQNPDAAAQAQRDLYKPNLDKYDPPRLRYDVTRNAFYIDNKFPGSNWDWPYDDDNRPDGARQWNGSNIWQWDKTRKQWLDAK